MKCENARLIREVDLQRILGKEAKSHRTVSFQGVGLVMKKAASIGPDCLP